MTTTVKFPESQDSATYTTAGVVPTSETDAIICLGSDSSTGASVISAANNTQGTLFIDFTKGSLTNVLIKIYGSNVISPAATDWYQETDESTSSGTVTLYPLILTLTANAKVCWHFALGAHKALKVTVTGTGTATSSSLDLKLNLRNN